MGRDVLRLECREVKWLLAIPLVILIGQVLDSTTYLVFVTAHPALAIHEQNPILRWFAENLTAWSVVMLKVGVALFVLRLWTHRASRPPLVGIGLASFAALSGIVGMAFNLRALVTL
jgi:hypothetical protein